VTLSADEAARFATLLQEHEDDLVAAWTDRVAAMLRGRLSPAELRRQTSELRRGFQQALEGAAQDLAGEPAAELRAQLSELSANRARQGFSATETAVSVFAFKEALLGILSEGTTLREYVAYSSFVDEAALFTFDSYVRVREELIADQAEQLLELSTPVVKLWEGVVAVPLVGTLDSARAQVVMERLLQTLVDTGSPYAIIDITGVPAVDTQVAQHILKTVVAARLMGADCIISGIRPQIAQTIVALGIEFGDIATKASLADALRYVLGKTKTKRSER
jgi:rsbT co-antagonist protein RsbR